MIWNAFFFILALVAMEGVAWASHKYLMHGPLWVWHASHHRVHQARFELNDLFGLAFAAATLALFWWATWKDWSLLWWSTLGITVYGLFYLLVHDGLVHRRFPLPWRPRRGYFYRLIQAHYLHHRTHTRDGAVSFGFLLPPDLGRLKRDLSVSRQSTLKRNDE
jgi:beta-carotene 3-hydroxylase